MLIVIYRVGTTRCSVTVAGQVDMKGVVEFAEILEEDARLDNIETRAVML